MTQRLLPNIVELVCPLEKESWAPNLKVQVSLAPQQNTHAQKQINTLYPHISLSLLNSFSLKLVVIEHELFRRRW
jgi:hypothetical protein